MAEEGLDIKSLTTLIMATPKVDVTQSIGRILRKKHAQALVIDIVDTHSLFQRHFKKRKTFYRKQKFKVIATDFIGYNNNEWEIVYDPQKNIKKQLKNKTDKKINKKIVIKTSKGVTEKKDKLLQGFCLIDDDDY